MTINNNKINKSIIIFFKFVYPCLLLYSRCYFYPWAGILMFHSNQLVAIPHRLNFGKVRDTAPALFFRRQKACTSGSVQDKIGLIHVWVYLEIFFRNNEMFQKQVNDKLTSICFCFLLCSSISSLVVLLNLSCSPWSSVSMFLSAFSASTS